MKKLFLCGFLSILLLSACTNAPKEDVNKKTAVVKPVVTETKPVVTGTQPAVIDTKPVITDTKPVIVDTKPIVIETKPVIVETKPVVIETKPVIVDVKPIVTETKPVIVETKPVVISNFTDISPKDASKLISSTPGIIIIDVSTLYSKGHLPAAINVPVTYNSFDSTLLKLNKDKTYLVYAHNDKISKLGAKKLIDAGFKKVYRLKGNYSAWVDAKLSVIKSK